MLLMVIVHCAPTLTPVQFAAIWGFDCVAEGFVFLSGFMIGYHYLRKFQRDGYGTTIDLWKRAVEFWALNAALTVFIVVYMHAVRDKPLPASFWGFVADTLTMRNQQYLSDILTMFVVFFLSAPIGLWLYNKGQLPFLLLICVNLFAINQIWPWSMSLMPYVPFPAGNWQVFFVIGAFLGIARRSGLFVANPKKAVWPLLLSFAIWIFILVLPWIFLFSNYVYPAFLVPHKWPLNIARLALMLPELMFFYYLFNKITPFMLQFKASWVFTQIGRHSLLAFCIHVPLMYIWWDVSIKWEPITQRIWLVIPMYAITVALFAAVLYLKPKLASAVKSIWE
jgi:hypothetical protein